MKIANLNGRATIVRDDGVLDIARASGNAFSSKPDAILGLVKEIRAWYEAHDFELDRCVNLASLSEDQSRLGPPVLRPSQVFAVGINYRDHGAEMGIATPSAPMIFTKFPSAIAGPDSTIALPTATCDWEVELVVVIGKGGRNIATSTALEHVAGFCVGQDISERTSQMAGSPPQFSIAKSHQGFAPIGPWLTTIDELANPLDLAIACDVNGETVQDGRTSAMVFTIPEVISYLSSVCELRVGDLIFTGTPSGAGFALTPPRFLQRGDRIESRIEGLGILRNTCS